MKKMFFRNILAVAVLGIMALGMGGCKETLSVDEKNTNPPVIASFSPAAASIDSEITIKGDQLQRVSKVTIGGKEVTIQTRISNTELIVFASSTGVNGKIKVYSNLGESESSSTFTYQYVAPEVSTAQLPASADMGGRLLISGSNMNVIQKVLFIDQSGVKSEGVILDKSKQEVLVKVPYVTGASAEIAFEYFDGSTTIETAPTEQAVTIVKNTPTVTTPLNSELSEGQAVDLEGENIDKIETITINDNAATINVDAQTANKLTFTVPSNVFPDGHNTGFTLKIYYFDNNEDQTLTSNLAVFVPEVYHFKNKTINARGRTIGIFRSFYSPQTGIAYENAKYQGELDPLACEMLELGNANSWAKTTCSAPNIPRVTEEQYNSIVPYVICQSSGTGTIGFGDPANSINTLRNFYFTEKGGNTVFGVPGGSANPMSGAGTPVVMYKALASTVPAELALINAVKSNTITKINNDLFPIDVAAHTIAGASLMSADISNITATLQSKDWATGVTQGMGGDSGVDVNGIFMAIHYNYKGYDILNPAKNILKIGFFHVKHLIFMPTSGEPNASFITFDTYWQKYPNNPVL